MTTVPDVQAQAERATERLRDHTPSELVRRLLRRVELHASAEPMAPPVSPQP